MLQSEGIPDWVGPGGVVPPFVGVDMAVVDVGVVLVGGGVVKVVPEDVSVFFPRPTQM